MALTRITENQFEGDITADAATADTLVLTGYLNGHNLLCEVAGGGKIKLKDTGNATGGGDLNFYNPSDTLVGAVKYVNDALYVESSVTGKDIIFQPGNVTALTLDGTDQSATFADNVTVTGTLTAGGLAYPTTDGTNGQVLTADGLGNVVWEAATGGMSALNDDLTPSLGGTLDCNGFDIEDTTQSTIEINNNVKLIPPASAGNFIGITVQSNSATGQPAITFRDSADNYKGKLLYDEANNNIHLKSSGAGLKLANNVWPSSDGAANQTLKTDGAGNLSWTTSSGWGDDSWMQVNNDAAVTNWASAAGTNAIAIGDNSSAAGTNNVAIGTSSNATSSTNSSNIAIGASASADGTYNIAIGTSAVAGDGVSDDDCIAIGRNADADYDGAIAIGYNSDSQYAGSVAIGYNADVSFGHTWGVAIGQEAQSGSGDSAVVVGYQSKGYGPGSTTVGAGGGNATYANYKTALGYQALKFNQAGDSVGYANTTGVGYDSRVSGADQVQLGNSSTTTYAYGAVQDRSDERDKADITDISYGLDFVNLLRPVTFKWDMRDDYFDEVETTPVLDSDGEPLLDENENPIMNTELVPVTKDGSRKRTREHAGIIAQELKTAMDTLGIDFGGYQNHAINGGTDVLTVGYTELIAPMLKAIQELSTKCDSLQAEIDTLKGV